MDLREVALPWGDSQEPPGCLVCATCRGFYGWSFPVWLSSGFRMVELGLLMCRIEAFACGSGRWWQRLKSSPMLRLDFVQPSSVISTRITPTPITGVTRVSYFLGRRRRGRKQRRREGRPGKRQQEEQRLGGEEVARENLWANGIPGISRAHIAT